MHRLTRLSLAHPLAVGLALLAVTLLLGSGLPRLRTEFGYRVLIGDEHPSIRALDALIGRFSGGYPIRIVWECGPGRPCQKVFDAESLAMAHAVTRRLAAVEGVKRAEGPSTARLLVPSEDGFRVRRFVEDGLPAADAAVLARRALQDPLWVGDLVSADGRVGAITVQPADTASETDRIVAEAVLETVAPFEARGFEFHFIGDAIDSVVAGRELAESTSRLIPAAVILIAAILFVLLRSWQLVALTLVTMAVALLWTFGLLGWLDWPQDGILEVLAPLVLIVGVCDAVHLLAQYAEELRSRQGRADDGDASNPLVAAAREVGGPCLLTTLTTAAALLSFVTSDLDTFVRLGVISAFGVTSCLLLTFTLLPLLARGLPPVGAPALRATGRWHSVLDAVVRTSERRAGAILAASAVLLVLCTIGWAGFLRVDTDWYETFGEQSRSVRWIRFVEERLGPADTLEIAIGLPESERFEQPEVLDKLVELSGYLGGLEGLGEPTSALRYLERLNRLLHDDDPAWERPGETERANAELVELLTLEDPGFLEGWLSFDRSRLRVSAHASQQPHAKAGRVLADVRAYVENRLPPDWEVELTGALAINYDWVRDVQATQLRSFPTAFLLVLLLVGLFLGSLRLAAAAMVPTLLPVVVTLGTMGWAGMSLDVGRAMIAAVLLGIAVDDGIHILSRYRREQQQGRGPREAIRAAVLHAGRPVVTTSVALSLGFLTLMASPWQTISSFGFFVALAIAGALLAVLLVLPALIFTFAGPTPGEAFAEPPRREREAPSRRGVWMAVAVTPVLAALLIAALQLVEGGPRRELACWVLPNARVAPLPGLASHCPLHANDAVRALESHGRAVEVADLAGLEAALAAAPAPLRSVRLAVLRDGQRQWQEVSVAEVPGATRALRVVSAAVIAALVLSLPLVLLRRSRSRAAVPFAFLYSALAVVVVTAIGGRASPWLHRLAIGAVVFAPAILGHLALTFPRERSILRDSPRIVLLPYAFSAVLLVVAALALERSFLLWPTVNYLLAALCVGAWTVMLVSCGFAVRESTSPRERTQGRLVLLGALFLPLLPTPILARNVSDPAAAVALYVAASVVLIPLPIGLAISRYNLFDLRQDARSWIGRLVYYGAGASVLTLAFGLALAVSGTEHPLRDPALLFVVSLGCLVAIEPIRARLLGWVEGLLSPQVDRMRQLRNVYLRHMAELRDGGEVARLLGETLGEAVGSRGGCVFLAGAAGWEPLHAFGQHPPARLDLAQDAASLLGPGSLVQVAAGEEGSGAAAGALLAAAAVEVAAAVEYGGERLGLVLLGSAGSGSPYTSLELDFIATATEHAALALHNARVAGELLAAERQVATGRTALALAHDVGKELGLLRNLAQRLPRRLADPARAQRDLVMIAELAEDLEQTLRGFVQDATGPARRLPGTLRFGDLVDRAVRSAARIHGPGRVVQSIAPGVGSVDASEGLERVLLNLLDNALLASEATDSVHLFATLHSSSVRVTISDRGCGMSELERQEAFELGFTTRPEGGGSGVGLAVSRQIVVGLGGSLALTANPRGGTVAVVEVPTLG